MKAPCKDCPDRVLGCHSKCEKYIAFSEENKLIYKDRVKNGVFINHTREKITAQYKKKKYSQ